MHFAKRTCRLLAILIEWILPEKLHKGKKKCNKTGMEEVYKFLF